MRLLLDASAIVKRYKAEPGHEAVARLLDQAAAVVAAAHCKTELACGLNRELHEGVIDLAQYGATMAEIAEDFGDFELVAITPEVEALALAAMSGHRLRAMDALHIGAAVVAQVDLFVSADRQQTLAAQAMGLKTELIEV